MPVQGAELRGAYYDSYTIFLVVVACLLTWGRPLQGVKIENFTSSWADGISFCALIHNFFPQAFDFNKLDRSNRKQNYDLAFKTGE